MPIAAPRRRAFRSGLLLPLGTAVAFLVVLYVSFVFGQRNERMLALVQHGYYPNVGLSNQLSSLLKDIQRGLYDAVVAADSDGLAKNDELYARFQGLLTEAAANPVADRDRLQALRRAMVNYYPFSRDTSLRMIRGDTFDSLTPALEAMKSRQTAVEALLNESIRRDHDAITAAFVTSHRIQKTTMTTMAFAVFGCIAALFVGFLLRNRLAATEAINEELSRRNLAILDSAGEGIFGLDQSGTATFINPAAARILGWTVDELLGRNLHHVIHDDAVAFDPDDQVTEFFRKDGSAIPVDYTARVINDHDGASNGVVVTFRDASERRAIERMKDEFVSTVSHELRTPLTSIRGALGLLSSGLVEWGSEKCQRLLTIATGNTDRLVRLINDILDLERIASGRVEPHFEFVDAHDLMCQTVDGVHAMAEQAGVTLLVAPVEATLWLDSDRIIQTLTNLVSNAIKFSPRDTAVKLTGTAADDHFLFSVSDRGRGIPGDQLETIFERFKQVDASDSRAKGGTGLGLAICRSIVQAHDGRIWAESGNGGGSTFHFTIPWADGPQSLLRRSS